ncbi:glutamate receptor ionotropic, kainate glr-3-like [Palaemon carinicauda]|uniref:glutamate receptor ionotropic, kainate glr-3-like n=1 Tax=Palaemon carinicauda TaxID=392227 RepID=UPI0035B5D216
MIGMVNRSEVELSVGPFSLNPDRNAAVDFTSPILYDNEIILTPRPVLENDLQGFFKPYPWNVWLLIICSLFLMALMLIGFEIVANKMKMSQTSDVPNKAFMFVFQTLMKGSSWIPDTDGGRFLAATWLLATIILISAYSGILVAMLTLPKVIIPIDSIDDLVHQNDIQWKLMLNTHTTKVLQESKEESRRLAFERKSGFLRDCNENRTELVEGKFAAICPQIRAKQILMWDYSNTRKCRVYIAKERVNFDMLAFALRRGSPYFKRVNRVIRAVHESGIYSQIMKKFYPSPTKCIESPTHDKPSGIAPLNIYSLGGPFLLLTGGLVFSSLVCLMEIAFYRRVEFQSV